MPRSRMNDHTGRFVDHCQVIIFKYDVESDIFRYQLGTYRFRYCDLDEVSAIYNKSTFCDYIAINAYLLLANQCLNSRPGMFGNIQYKYLVESISRPFRHFNLKNFISQCSYSVP